MSPENKPAEAAPDPIPAEPEAPPQAPTPAKSVCLVCTGRGVRSFATEDVPCAACGGTGRAK